MEIWGELLIELRVCRAVASNRYYSNAYGRFIKPDARGSAWDPVGSNERHAQLRQG